jgi:hypothetical protein
VNLAIAIYIVVIAALFVGAATAYRIYFRPIICDHFGEECRARGNVYAKRRRRSFERLCGQIAASLFAAGIVAAIPDFGVPISSGVIGASELILALIGGLFS